MNDVGMNLTRGRQRLLVFAILLILVAAVGLWPSSDRRGDAANAGTAVACDKTPTALSGLVTGNALALGNGTTVTPCLANAPIHMRIGYSNGDSGGATGSGTAFTTDGITFPDGKFTRDNTDCGIGGPADSTIAKPTILKFADGTQSPGPSNVRTYTGGAVWVCNGNQPLYTRNNWNTSFAQSDDKMLVHMRMKNLQINRNAFMTVVPQSSVVAPSADGTGEYKLTFTPANQGNAGWNIGDSCVYTDLWLTADTHIKVNIFSINTTIGALAGDGSLWGSILSSIASGNDIPGLELDGWVYYMNINKGADCTGSPTTLKMPSTDIVVTP